MDDVKVSKLVEALEKVRDDSSMWKIAKVSGYDSYHGLPPLCRYIDSVLRDIGVKE